MVQALAAKRAIAIRDTRRKSLGSDKIRKKRWAVGTEQLA
jgi:hypothetical protein